MVAGKQTKSIGIELDPGRGYSSGERTSVLWNRAPLAFPGPLTKKKCRAGIRRAVEDKKFGLVRFEPLTLSSDLQFSKFHYSASVRTAVAGATEQKQKT